MDHSCRITKASVTDVSNDDLQQLLAGGEKHDLADVVVLDYYLLIDDLNLIFIINDN